MLKKVVKSILIILLIIIFIVAAYLIFMEVTDYRPPKELKLSISKDQEKTLQKGSKVSILTYNIGYGGMDKDQDFFMDGGTGSRSSSKEKTMENIKGVVDFAKSQETDFVFIQEVDVNATRSYHINQYDYIEKKFSDYSSSLAINYKVPWVPVPVTKPMGSVEGGIMTLSKYNVKSALRYQYPGSEKWPRQLVEVDRCFLESHIPVQGGKDLVIINSHLSAFDKGGTIRKQQLGFLKEHITKLYKEGNYVIVGGDWNHQLPGTDASIFKTTEKWPDWLQKLPTDFIPEGFRFAVDPSIGTNRTDALPYKKDVNFLAVIDGFLLSPNVELNSIEGHDLQFKYTDHNPVTMEFTLK